MKHYVYRTTYVPTGAFYIGVRSCKADPKDDEYMGSGSFLFMARYGRKGYRKEVVAEFLSREEAEIFEVSLISKSKLDTLCMNIRVQRYNSAASLKTRTHNKCM